MIGSPSWKVVLRRKKKTDRAMWALLHKSQRQKPGRQQHQQQPHKLTPDDAQSEERRHEKGRSAATRDEDGAPARHDESSARPLLFVFVFGKK